MSAFTGECPERQPVAMPASCPKKRIHPPGIPSLSISMDLPAARASSTTRPQRRQRIRSPISTPPPHPSSLPWQSRWAHFAKPDASSAQRFEQRRRPQHAICIGAGHGDMAFLGNANAGLPWSTNEVMGLIIDFLKNALQRSSRTYPAPIALRNH